MLVHRQLFNLSDAEAEFQVNDHRSFEDFVGLGVMNDSPNAPCHPLSGAAKQRDHVRSATRACVEHVFGYTTISMGAR